MQFIELTEGRATGTGAIIVNLDEIAFYKADTRNGPEGAFNCGILTLRQGGVLRVMEDLEVFRQRLALATTGRP